MSLFNKAPTGEPITLRNKAGNTLILDKGYKVGLDTAKGLGFFPVVESDQATAPAKLPPETPVNSLDYLRLSVKEALEKMEVNTLAELQALDDDQLLAITGIGEKVLAKIKE